MSYSPTVWQKGDVISATKLNKIEQGISNIYSKPTNALVLNISCDVSTGAWGNLDQTLRTIYTAVLSGKKVIVCFYDYYNGVSTLTNIEPVQSITAADQLENTNYEKWITTAHYNFMEHGPDYYPSICWW